MIFCDFCALSPTQRSQLLGKFREMLKPDGKILMDIHSLVGFEAREESASYELNQLNGFWSPDDYYGFVNTFKYEQERVILDKYTIVEKDRTRTVYNWLQCFDEESLRNEFDENGLQIIELYSNVAGAAFAVDSDTIALVATLA